MKPIKAPKHLSKEAVKWWNKIMESYEIEDESGLLILSTALESFDRMREAQEIIKKDGMTVRDKWGQLKANPVCTVERDSRSAMLQALKQLNLDIVPLQGRVGRPEGR